MNIMPFSDEKIIESWSKNASPWVAAVRNETIESRKLCTDQAIVDAILDHSKKHVLDLGCGEGWLTRGLNSLGFKAVGVDIVAELVEAARKAGPGDFHVTSYEEIANGKFQISVDTIVSNFSLLGKESVDGIFKIAPQLLRPKGKFIIQTLHPVAACGELPYKTGWREGAWTEVDSGIVDPAPWYFRTLENWLDLFAQNHFQLLELREPINPSSEKRASVVFVAELALT